MKRNKLVKKSFGKQFECSYQDTNTENRKCRGKFYLYIWRSFFLWGGIELPYKAQIVFEEMCMSDLEILVFNNTLLNAPSQVKVLCYDICN